MYSSKSESNKPLPDIIKEDLDVLFIGYNPGLKSAQEGHHYAGKSNRFWKLLYDAGLTPRKLHPYEDRELLHYGYGSTNIIDRETKSAAELTDEEYEVGREKLKGLLRKYHPKIACYVGIGVYQRFAKKKEIKPGLQSNSIVEGVLDYVCSSSSGLNRIPIDEQINCFKGVLELLKNLK
ncbi:TDG/mug DNA glycosylase family protein [Anaerosolibacter carboniphilus]|uniref:TDG/mug DNA glycosylase family protein n=1 Tax=Anaerosolibacter carboniphilus TaxID=1417629 RepID=A0A841KXU4_9FIRM|nr:mismatch-specific DNA-glycosylase [Anaerosolibacter carboniphilus]MBB6218271.1 TDG/mug DNA glycosylase family protein [Anaerosolibacter carboniphilus]